MNWYKINTSRHNYKIYIENLIKYNFEEGIGDQHLRVTLFFLNDIRLDSFPVSYGTLFSSWAFLNISFGQTWKVLNHPR